MVGWRFGFIILIVNRCVRFELSKNVAKSTYRCIYMWCIVFTYQKHDEKKHTPNPIQWRAFYIHAYVKHWSVLLFELEMCLTSLRCCWFFFCIAIPCAGFFFSLEYNVLYYVAFRLMCGNDVSVECMECGCICNDESKKRKWKYDACWKMLVTLKINARVAKLPASLICWSIGNGIVHMLSWYPRPSLLLLLLLFLFSCYCLCTPNTHSHELWRYVCILAPYTHASHRTIIVILFEFSFMFCLLSPFFFLHLSFVRFFRFALFKTTFSVGCRSFIRCALFAYIYINLFT